MIQIAEVLPTEPAPLWMLAKQCGVTHVVGVFPVPFEEGMHRDQMPWSYSNLLRMKTAYENGGFQFTTIEARPPLTRAKLGLDGRDEEIDWACDLIRNMGALGIAVWCHEWMPVLNWTRTSTTTPGRGGALVTGYDHELMRNAPRTEYGEITEEQALARLDELHKKKHAHVAPAPAKKKTKTMIKMKTKPAN